jgi:hypothetical protein
MPAKGRDHCSGLGRHQREHLDSRRGPDLDLQPLPRIEIPNSERPELQQRPLRRMHDGTLQAERNRKCGSRDGPSARELRLSDRDR